MRKDVIVVGVLVVISISLLIFSLFSYKQKAESENKYQKINTENKELVQENKKMKLLLKAKENQNEEKVKFDTEEFLHAFFDWDSSKGERSWTKITPFVSENAKKTIMPAGVETDKIERTEKDKTIVSKLDKLILYFTAIDDMNSNVFARVWYNTTVNGITSQTQMLLDLKLRYDSNKDRWIVDDIKIQQELNDKGVVR